MWWLTTIRTWYGHRILLHSLDEMLPRSPVWNIPWLRHPVQILSWRLIWLQDVSQSWCARRSLLIEDLGSGIFYDPSLACCVGIWMHMTLSTANLYQYSRHFQLGKQLFTPKACESNLNWEGTLGCFAGALRAPKNFLHFFPSVSLVDAEFCPPTTTGTTQVASLAPIYLWPIGWPSRVRGPIGSHTLEGASFYDIFYHVFQSVCLGNILFAMHLSKGCKSSTC